MTEPKVLPEINSLPDDMQSPTEFILDLNGISPMARWRILRLAEGELRKDISEMHTALGNWPPNDGEIRARYEEWFNQARELAGVCSKLIEHGHKEDERRERDRQQRSRCEEHRS